MSQCGPADIECFVAESCRRLGFILWRVNAIGVSNDAGNMGFQ